MTEANSFVEIAAILGSFETTKTTKKHGKLKYTAKQSFSKQVPSEVAYFPDVVSVFRGFRGLFIF